MKILILNEADYGGGAAIAALRVYEALSAKSDHEVYFKAKRTRNSKNGINVRTWADFLNKLFKKTERELLNQIRTDKHDLLNIDLGNLFDLTGDLKREIDKINPDIINLHWINNGFISLRLIKKLANDYKILWTLHDMWPMLGIQHYDRGEFETIKRGSIFRLLDNWAIKQKGEIFRNENIHFGCISNWMKDELLKRWDIPESRIHITPNTLSNKITETSMESNSEEKEGLFTIILSSKASDTDMRKGFDLLKNVISRIESENIQLIVLGCKQKKDYKIGKVKVTEYENTNNEDEIIGYYQESDLHICCSRMDNYPNTVLEANGLSIPTIAFNVGGLKDMIDHGKTGFLVSPFDTEAMANLIDKISKDLPMREELKKNLKARKKFNSQENISGIYLSVFNELLLSNF